MKTSGRFVESIALAILLLFGAGCGRNDSPQAAKAVPTGAPVHEKHWGYEDGPESFGPAHWGEMPGNALCALGKFQSPIALADAGERAAEPAEGPALRFAYKRSALSMINNGHTVQVNHEAGSSVSEAGTSYVLAQLHFHAPSEHTLDGKSFPLEIHLVHLDVTGKPALVVGLFVREGAENTALAAALRALPAMPGGSSAPAGATVDASALLPAARAHFAYDGSLTTPPCSENILWRVMREPIEMSTAQIDAFRSLPHMGDDNRPLQRLGSRRVLLVQ